MRELIKIEKVKNKNDLDLFAKLPFKIYQGDKNFVPPLISDVKETVSKNKNPYFRHADIELFLAYFKNEIVGRIAGIIDYNYINHHKKNVGFFGFFEVVNNFEVACALFDTVKEWLKSKGMELMVGPANPALNDECAFLYEGFDSPPVIKMSYNPPYYLEFAERYGMEKAKDLYAYYINLDQFVPQKIANLIEKLKKKERFQVRNVNLKILDVELRKIKEIYNDAWQENWDFTPLTDEEINYLGKKLKPIAKSEIIPIVEIDGEPAGISIALPNYNEVLIHLNGKLFPFGIFKFLYYQRKIKSGRLWALGVKKKYRKTGVDALLYYETFLGGKKLGYEWGEVSWILEDNIEIIRPIETWGVKLYKKYRVYQYRIT
ncbi:MAG: hypothetical protein ABIK76_03600 [candidate division WOR-3 bacterium]